MCVKSNKYKFYTVAKLTEPTRVAYIKSDSMNSRQSAIIESAICIEQHESRRKLIPEIHENNLVKKKKENTDFLRYFCIIFAIERYFLFFFNKHRKVTVLILGNVIQNEVLFYTLQKYCCTSSGVILHMSHGQPRMSELIM